MFLARLFYYSPESHETASSGPVLLNSDDWQAQWPLDAEALAPVAAMFKTHSEESLPQARQRLFIGSLRSAVSAVGFSSADREFAIWQIPYIALRQWMRENGIQFEMQQNEPAIILVAVAVGGTGLPRMAVIMDANNSSPRICFRGRPSAFWTYLSIAPGHPFYLYQALAC